MVTKFTATLIALALAVSFYVALESVARAYQPDATPLTEGWVLSAVETARVVMPPPCEPNLLAAPLDTGVIARAEMPHELLFSCRVYFHRDTIASYTRLTVTGDRMQRRAVLAYVCAVAAHELGHLRGLEHTHDGGLMDEAAIATPAECRAWALTVVPKKVKTKRKKGSKRDGFQRRY